MQYVLKNKFLELRFSSVGAELTHIIDKDGVNRLHDPIGDTWHRVSPTLFPIVSSVHNNKFMYDGKEYNLHQHGFHRDLEYEPVLFTDKKIVFKLASNEETLKVYPFKFEFYLTYTLKKDTVEISYKTKNIDTRTMYYMVGGHPAFSCPIFDNETKADYYLEFEKNESVMTNTVENGCISNHYIPYLNNEKVIEANKKQDYFNTIMLKGCKSKYVDLKCRKHNKVSRVYFSDFELLAFWYADLSEVKFLCIEPWNGIPKDYDAESLEKMGTLNVAPNKTQKYSFKIKIIN